MAQYYVGGLGLYILQSSSSFLQYRMYLVIAAMIVVYWWQAIRAAPTQQFVTRILAKYQTAILVQPYGQSGVIIFQVRVDCWVCAAPR